MIRNDLYTKTWEEEENKKEKENKLIYEFKKWIEKITKDMSSEKWNIEKELSKDYEKFNEELKKIYKKQLESKTIKDKDNKEYNIKFDENWKVILEEKTDTETETTT